jgi:hypothetical protein
MSYLAAPPRDPRKHYTRGNRESQVPIFWPGVLKNGHLSPFFLAANLLPSQPMGKMRIRFGQRPASHGTLVVILHSEFGKIEN